MKIIHLSDLHFGTEREGDTNLLTSYINELTPDLIVISGDFVQVGSKDEFLKAKKFINDFECPVFTVPGNHDIPRYDFLERFFRPFKKYKKHICDDLFPVFDNKDVIISGINTARPVLPHWNWANGAVSDEQLSQLLKPFKSEDERVRIAVFHHPIHKAESAPLNTIVFGGKNALNAMEEHKVHLVLTGHVHHASITTMGGNKHTVIYLSASTALSSRIRDQENGFNVIDVNNESINIKHYTKNEGSFTVQETYHKKKD